MGVIKPIPNACKISDGTWGSCSEQQQETGSSGLSRDAQWAHSTGSSSMGLLSALGSGLSQQLGFSGDIGNMGN